MILHARQGVQRSRRATPGNPPERRRFRARHRILAFASPARTRPGGEIGRIGNVLAHPRGCFLRLSRLQCLEDAPQLGISRANARGRGTCRGLEPLHLVEQVGQDLRDQRIARRTIDRKMEQRVELVEIVERPLVEIGYPLGAERGKGATQLAQVIFVDRLRGKRGRARLQQQAQIDEIRNLLVAQRLDVRTTLRADGDPAVALEPGERGSNGRAPEAELLRELRLRKTFPRHVAGIEDALLDGRVRMHGHARISRPARGGIVSHGDVSPRTKDGSDAYQNEARLALRRSVISMCPGLCVIENGGLADWIAECGVTPQAQNTGSSSGATSVVPMPRYGFARSSMPMSDGAPRCTGAPCTRGKRDVTCTARIAFAGVIGRIDTMSLP